MSAHTGMSRSDESDGPEEPAVGTLVETACGGSVRYRADTPRIAYRGKTVYFCIHLCRQDHERDPHSSCLAGRIRAEGS